MTTTENFQKKTDFYSSIEEINNEKKNKNKINTNPRYSNFFQTHFTVGDIQQFEQYRNKYKISNCNGEIVRDQSVGNIIPDIYWESYEHLDGKSVSNTFKYIFHKFKKGIFIQILNNKVKVMLPFSKHNYTNEWSQYITYNTNKYNSLNDFFKYICCRENRKFKPKYINKHKNQWYGNNSLLRYEYPIQENDSGIPMISDMFKELCKYRNIPDIEFFINKRDFPLLRKNKTESYNYIFGDNVPLSSHKYNKYSPILSMCSTDDHADIPIPTWDDWSRVSIEDDKYFPKSNYYKKYNFNTPWNQRIPTAIFRGNSTGFGTTIDTNMRLKISLMSEQNIKDDKDGLPFLDAGITRWNLRPRKIKGKPYFDTLDDLNIPLKSFMNIEEQSKYKYIINIDGHVSAYRLSQELNTGSLILLVESTFKLWFSHLLKPYVHYVPIKEDLSDLIEKIQWCKNYDLECFNITENAKKFYSTFLEKDGILNYLQQLLINLKHIIGSYVYYTSPLKIQFYNEQTFINKYINTIPVLPEARLDITNIKIPPHTYRNFDFLQGIQWYILKSKGSCLTKVESLSFKKSNLVIYNFEGRTFLLKDCKNKDELNHECFLGLFCINSLLKHVPNFSYTFGLFENKLLTEYFNSENTFYNYLIGSQFKFKDFLHILIQISLALHTSQQLCLFIHYDLYPWNIILNFHKKPRELYYLIINKYIKIKSTIIPIIIDYGKSKAIYKNTYYGFIKPYSNSKIHDILTILISSLYILIDKRTLSKADLSSIFILTEFFSPSSYTNHKKFMKIKELKQFLSNAKKYSEMTYSNKFELNKLTPIDFINFLQDKFNINLNYTTKRKKTMRSTTSLQVYQYINSYTDEERYNSYIDTLERITSFTGGENKKEKDSSVYCRVFNEIISNIQMLCPDIPNHIIQNSFRNIPEKKINWSNIIIPIIPNFPVYDIDIFDCKLECDLLYDYYKKCNYNRDCENVIKIMQFLLDIFDIDDIDDFKNNFEGFIINNTKYLEYTSKYKTFIYMYNKIFNLHIEQE